LNLLVIGCKGQLGTDLSGVAKEDGHRVTCVDFPDIDITDSAKTSAVIRSAAPEVIINSAAYTAVDDAEKNEKLAFAVNADGVANIARAAKEIGATVVHFSTDYVFDGTKRTPYVETDAPNPQTAYGRTKLAGERNLLGILDASIIVRIAWLYGVNGANFVKAILSRARKNSLTGEPVKVVNDQIGNPTHTVDVCRQVMTLLDTKEYGVYHATSEGVCSWYDFARLIVKTAGIAVEVVPCTTKEFPRPAPRPAYSVLENARLKKMGRNQMPQWEKAYGDFWTLYESHNPQQ
jgi:dTDP-4-dehydrorhamnose reductase